MIDPHSIFLLVSTLIAVVCLILLIAVYKLNPFITLFLISLALAVVAGMPPSTVIHSFEVGVGATLGHIAIVVALGTMLGKMMAESGGADQIAETLIRIFGEKRVHWASATGCDCTERTCSSVAPGGPIRLCEIGSTTSAVTVSLVSSSKS